MKYILSFLFFWSFSSLACIPSPIEIDFHKVEKIVFVEASITRPLYIVSSLKLSLRDSKKITLKKDSSLWSGNKGYYINVPKAGEYTLKISDGDKMITLRLNLKEDKNSTRNTFSESVSQTKSLSSSCGGAFKVKYD